MTNAQDDVNGEPRHPDDEYQIMNISKTCRYFGMERQTFYEWKQAHTGGEGRWGLMNGKSRPGKPAFRMLPEQRGKSFVSGKTESRATTHFPVSVGMPRFPDFFGRRVSIPDAQRNQPAFPECQKMNCVDPTVREAGVRPPLLIESSINIC